MGRSVRGAEHAAEDPSAVLTRPDSTHFTVSLLVPLLFPPATALSPFFFVPSPAEGPLVRPDVSPKSACPHSGPSQPWPILAPLRPKICG